MNTQPNTHDEIELRSEKVREILGEIPTALVIWGIVIIVVILVALLGVICIVPYPYSKGESILRHLLYF